MSANATTALASQPSQKQQSAHNKLFKFVTEVIVGATPVSHVSGYSSDIRHWVVVDDKDISFQHACEALAGAISDGLVPEKGLAVLHDLAMKCEARDPPKPLPEILRKALSLPPLPAEDEQTSAGSSHLSERTEEIFLVVADYLDPTPVTFPLEDTIRGTDNVNLDFISKETDVQVSMSGMHGLSVRLEGPTVDAAVVLVEDLLLVATKRAYDEWKKAQDEVARAEAEAQREAARIEAERAEAEARALRRPMVVACYLRHIFRYVAVQISGQPLSIQQEQDVEDIVDAKDITRVNNPLWPGANFEPACQLLKKSVLDGLLPWLCLAELVDLRENMRWLPQTQSLDDLAESLETCLCPRCEDTLPRARVCETCHDTRRQPCPKCGGSGRFAPACRVCSGTGKLGKINNAKCRNCGGAGKKDVGECKECFVEKGKGARCRHCVAAPKVGKPRPLCQSCVDAEDARAKAVAQAAMALRPSQKRDEPPAAGMTIERCSAGDLTRLKNLWNHREGEGELVEAWKVDNPLRTYKFIKRREQLKRDLGRTPDGLEGFHGTHPDAVVPICSDGFDKSRRSGQVYGAGEYFAKNPTVSIGYCKGGEYMLVCRLTLGVESSTPQNQDGDHIWEQGMGYYVIKEPEQVLPTYIIRFSSERRYYGDATSASLEKTLPRNGQGKWSNKKEEEVKPVPQQRPCCMTRDFATVLWMGFLHMHFSDEQLEKDIREFFKKHARAYCTGLKVQIVSAHFKKAHIILEQPIPREVVHKLNSATFVENGTPRTICVDDGHGSPGQKCPKFIAGYCRGQNLRFTHPCWCKHEMRPTEMAKFSMTRIDLDSAKGVELREKFMDSAPFHNGHPRIVGIKAIHNDVLAKCHDAYREYLTNKHHEEPAVQELYHGTNNNILDTLYQHGLQPPSDTQASNRCPKSGGKGLCTSLCNNDCTYCTEKHDWNKCHMYGLGIYLADMAQKSHRYVSQPKGDRYRIIVCQVVGKAFQVEGHLRRAEAMHDVVNVRSLTDDIMDDMVEQCQACESSFGVGASIQGLDGETWGRVVCDEGDCWRMQSGRIAKKSSEGMMWKWAAADMACDNLEVAEKSDLLFIKGLGNNVRPGFSVVNSEYIAFHPHQCLPKYEIEYTL